MAQRLLVALVGIFVAAAAHGGPITETTRVPYTLELIGSIPSPTGGGSTFMTVTTQVQPGQVLTSDDINLVDFNSDGVVDVFDNAYSAGGFTVQLGRMTAILPDARVFLYEQPASNLQGFFGQGSGGTLIGENELLPGATVPQSIQINIGGPSAPLGFSVVTETNQLAPDEDPLVDALLKLDLFYVGGTITQASEVPVGLFFAGLTFATDAGQVSATIESLRLTAVPLPAAAVLLGSVFGFAALGRVFERFRSA